MKKFRKKAKRTAKTITPRTLRDRIDDNVIRVTEDIWQKGNRRYVNVVDRDGQPSTLEVVQEEGS